MMANKDKSKEGPDGSGSGIDAKVGPPSPPPVCESDPTDLSKRVQGKEQRETITSATK